MAVKNFSAIALPDLATTIEMHLANPIMMRNISLGAALFALLQVVNAIRSSLWGSSLVIVGIGITAAVMALNRAQKFDYWYHREIFYEALNYGSSTEEVLALSRKLTAKEENHGLQRKNKE